MSTPFRVALTFDAEHPDRPGSRDAALVVELLERLEVEASFFLQGRWAEAFPALAGRIASRHLIGSHSHYHARMPLFSPAGLRADVRAAERAIRRATAVDPRPWFRFPFGSGAERADLVGLLGGLGYRSIGWDVEPREWRVRSSAREVADAVVAASIAHGDGAIVLLHTWPAPVARALPDIVARLHAEGAELVRLDALDLPSDMTPIGRPTPAAT